MTTTNDEQVEAAIQTLNNAVQALHEEAGASRWRRRISHVMAKYVSKH